MNNLPAFTRYFAELVWLLAHRSEARDQQKEALRLALAELAEGRHALVFSELTFALATTFHDGRLNDAYAWMNELCVRMSAHSVRAVEFEQGASAHDVFNVGRALSTSPMPGDDGEAFDEKIVAFGPTHVAVHLGGMGFVRRATPASTQVAPIVAVHTPSLGVRAIAPPAISTPAVVHAVELDDDNDSRQPEAVVEESTRALEAEFLRVAPPGSGLKELLTRLDSVSDPRMASRLIEDVAREAEDRARQGLWVDLAEVLDRLYQRADALRDGDVKRSYQLAIRRLERPALLKGLAQLLPRRREMREMVTQLLARTGEMAADALIDLLINSETVTARHAYRSALSQCPAAIPALVQLIGDSRWYVVRNSIELLAEFAPPDADVKIAATLAHSEPRVRRAAAAALAKLATPRAMLALLQAAQDPAPEVRLQVALALGGIRNSRAVPWLIEALDKEQDADVQAALLGALGKIPTEDAVTRLARAAGGGGILIRKSVTMRLHAVDALAEAGTPSARSVLRGLLHDRAREVREAAQRGLSIRPRAGDEAATA